MSCKSSVSKIAAEFSPFVFLPLSTRAYFKGRAYIKIILKNHARSYFAGRSYYRGNTVNKNSLTKKLRKRFEQAGRCKQATEHILLCYFKHALLFLD